LFAFDDLGRQGGDKAFMRVGEIGVIGEGELIIQASFACFGAAVRLWVNLSPGKVMDHG
jgi:hypothetical protein